MLPKEARAPKGVLEILKFSFNISIRIRNKEKDIFETYTNFFVIIKMAWEASKKWINVYNCEGGGKHNSFFFGG